MTLSVGTRLGPYEVLAPLGAGGMGEVYRARDTKLKRDVAIKVLPQSLAGDPEALARFEREALAVAALSHPNILAIHDFGTQDGVTYAVMELLEGGALREKLEAGAIPQKQAIDYALQIAKGLSAAHEKGVVHRDLKPENLFVSKDGHVKILDFGLAKREETVELGKETSAPTASGHTQPGTVMGTVGYMSPEQVRGLPVDHRSDIFSFGAILYEMFTGKRAFKRDTAVDTMAAILKEEPPEPSDSMRKIPPALDRVVRHCVEKDRENRFQSANDIAFALAEASTSGSGEVESHGNHAGFRTASWVAGAAAVLLVALAAIVLARRRPDSPAGVTASIAVLPFTNLSADKDQEFFSDGLSEELMGLLAKVKQLRVAGRMSSFAFKGKTEELASIGQKLHVTVVLEGSVRRSGDQLRVSTQLVNVADGFQIWAETYDRKVADVFRMQDEIAAAVVAALKVKLLPSESPVTSQHRTSSTDAYNQYLLGRQFHNRANPEGMRLAAAAYEKAIALDPNYAAAYAGLAISLVQQQDYVGTAAEAADSQRNAKLAADRAVALAPGLPEGYIARGNVRTYIERDWIGAQADYQRAFSLDPSQSQTHAFYARLLARLGRLPAAIAEARKATELDPLLTGSWNILGCYLYSTGEIAEARRVLQRAIEISPENEWARFFLGITELLAGNPEIARSVVGSPTTALRKTVVALAEHDLGHAKEAQQALDDLIANFGETAAYHIASVYARRGEPDRAFAFLEVALNHRESQIARLKSDPLMASLRDDPRYEALLKKLNLPLSK